jgi:Tfp pilus assembly protein PilF
MRTKFLGISLVWLVLFLPSCTKTSPSAQFVPDSKNFEIYLNQGIQSLHSGDFGMAIVHLQRAVAASPKSDQAHNFLGIAYFQQKNYQLSKIHFEKAIALQPSYAEAYNNLGSNYFVLQEFEKAKGMFKKAIEFSPKKASPYYSLGNLLLMMGQQEEGITYLAKGIELDPNFLEKNESLITKFSYQDYNDAEVNFTYAKIFASAGNADKTLIYLEKAEKSNFQSWNRILTEKEFEKVKDSPAIQNFIKRVLK